MDDFDNRTFLASRQLVRLLGTIKSGPTAVATITVTETAAAEFSTQPAVLAGDLIVQVIKPTYQAGLGIAGSRVNAANDARVWFVNPTAGGVTPTGSEVYSFIVLR